MRRVLVAASQPLAAYDLEARLSDADDFEVVRTFMGLGEVDTVVAGAAADVLVVDVGALPDLLHRLRDQQPELKVVAVGPGDPDVIRSAFELGADGYHVHTADSDEFAAGLREVLLATEFRTVQPRARLS